jgi:transcriptional regulator GlxA family with amidase domain
MFICGLPAFHLRLSEPVEDGSFYTLPPRSPHRWPMNLRVLEAQEMLKDGKGSQADFALAAGFADQSQFSRVFKEVVGVPPGAWRRAHRQ